MDINRILNKYPKLNYIQRVVRRASDPEFIKEVIEIGKDPLRIHIISLGEENPGKLVYIAQTMGCDGLFADLRFIINELFFADRFGFTPVVKIPSNSPYAESCEVNGSKNPFEYYFEPVSSVSLESASHSIGVVEHNYYQRLYIRSLYKMDSGYLPSEEYMREAARIVKLYFHFNKPTDNYLHNNVGKLLKQGKTLGVHVRGADFKRHYVNHPNMVTVEEYLQQATKEYTDEKYDQLFLATDDLEAIEVFRQNFGEKLVYYEDVIRTDGDETVMHSTSGRELHHYKLGLEVIRDMYTLSMCDGIIAGLSNVSIFARIMKLSRGQEFNSMKYINKGIKG